MGLRAFVDVILCSFKANKKPATSKLMVGFATSSPGPKRPIASPQLTPGTYPLGLSGLGSRLPSGKPLCSFRGVFA